MASSDDGSGFDEFGQPRFAADETLDAFAQLGNTVLAAYGYRCVFTGEQFAPTPGLVHPELYVVPVRHLAAGGPLAIGNCLPMISLAARAFRAGQIIIAADYTVIADFSVLNAELASRMRPDARLVLPSNPAFRPSLAHLAYHRRSVLGN